MWKIFVISLDSDVQRRAELLPKLEGLPLDVEVIPAVDGRSGLPADLEQHVCRESIWRGTGFNPANAELACALSHQKAYQKIVDEGLDGAIILEDDAVPQPEFFEFVAERGYEHASMILLDHSSAWTFSFWRPVSLPGVQAVRLSRNADRNTAYSIKRPVAERIIQHSRPLRGLADWPVDITKFGALAAMPTIVGHPPEDGDQSHIDALRKASRAAGTPEGFRKQRVSLSHWRRKYLKIRKNFERRIS